ncbi:AbrB/MazE/SpoVT family DNA-binding domain-containing protein [Siminovitchia fortis]|uniref:AbrB/MazE/SpoVT family DNA-binding domain-containing protein n=1 Tax=Siminovitchia fortis TaxID=254758 RepID=UPI0011A8541D|nr:AbrB/MazE/SpoVT family DNA-binding domain-containing protein [Siminovitchia fortis]
MEEDARSNGNEVDHMAIPTTVQKWGNSLAVRIPKDVAERINIHQGSEMEISVTGKGVIMLVPKKQPKKYSLEELLAKCSPENRHGEIDFGVEGKELI